MKKAIKKDSRPGVRRLRPLLERLRRTYHRGFLSSDPVEFVHMFSSPGDREVVGLIASLLAYGRVDGIKRAVGRVLELMDWKPYRFVRAFDPKRGASVFSGFVYRFNSGRDVACLIYIMKQMIEGSGSIGAFFMEGYSPRDRNIKGALSSFSKRALSLDRAGIYRGMGPEADKGLRFFFPDPASGSPCKRLNLYLRWMVRKDDGLDFGLWKGVAPSKLIIPLDTHIARISRNIGLTKRATADWKTAEEITGALKQLDPRDPLKYDFALTRLGILDRCPKRVELTKCRECMIKEVCIL